MSYRKVGIVLFAALIVAGAFNAYANDVERVTKRAVINFVEQLYSSFSSGALENDIDKTIYDMHTELKAPVMNGPGEYESSCVQWVEESWPAKAASVAYRDTIRIEGETVSVHRSIRAEYGHKVIKEESLYITGQFTWEGSNLVIRNPTGNLKSLTGKRGLAITQGAHGGIDVESRFGPVCWNESTISGSRVGHFVSRVD